MVTARMDPIANGGVNGERSARVSKIGNSGISLQAQGSVETRIITERMPRLGLVPAEIIGSHLHGSIAFKGNAPTGSAHVSLADPRAGRASGVQSAPFGFKRAVVDDASTHQTDGSSGTSSSATVVVRSGVSTVNRDFRSGRKIENAGAMSDELDGSAACSTAKMVSTTTAGTTQQIGQMHVTVCLSVSGITPARGGAVVSVSGTCSVVVVHLGLTASRTISVSVMVRSVPTAEFCDATDSCVGGGFARVFAIGEQLSANVQVSVVTGSQGEGVGALQVDDYVGSDVDSVGSEYADFIGVVGSVEGVGLVHQSARHERAVAVKDGSQSGVDGQGSAGEDQFGHLRTENFDRTVGSVTRCATSCLTLAARGGNVRIGGACVVDEGCGGLDVDPASSARRRSGSATILDVAVSAVDSGGARASVGPDLNARIDDEVGGLEINRTPRTRSAASTGFVGTGSAFASTGPDVTADGQGAGGYDLDRSGPGTTLSIVSSPSAGASEQVGQVGIPIDFAEGTQGIELSLATDRLGPSADSAVGSATGLLSSGESGCVQVAPPLEGGARGLKGVCAEQMGGTRTGSPSGAVPFVSTVASSQFSKLNARCICAIGAIGIQVCENGRITGHVDEDWVGSR